VTYRERHRDLMAAMEAERTYREAYERLCELAQVQKPTKPLHARKTSARAVIALRAYRSASRPPGPIVPASNRPCCPDCMVYLALPGDAKPVPLVEAML
jgi:hypothetical protein